MEQWRKSLYLAHHGILGQKWGIRNGPPYPLDAADRSAREKKANRKSVGKTANVSTSSKQSSEPTVISKKNEPVALHETPESSFVKLLGKISPAIKSKQARYKDYTIKTKDGTKVGTLSTYVEDSGDTINGVWLGVNSKYEGNGYGQSAMRLAIDYARRKGFKYFTLEVPTNSPNARHIYEKYGFKDTGETMLGDEDDVWGGLTRMKLTL